MKISELVDLLSSYDQDLTVFTNGYEGGLYEVEEDLLRVLMTVYDPFENKGLEEYFGPHHEVRPHVEGAAEGLLIDRPYWQPTFHDPDRPVSGAWGAVTETRRQARAARAPDAGG